jgi:Heparinase II/III-like protein/Heparinase II/III N-terminus
MLCDPRLIRLGLRRPKRAALRWLVRQVRAEIDQLNAPRRARRLTAPVLLKRLGADSLETLWARLGERPSPGWTAPLDTATLETLVPGGAARLRSEATAALARRVDLLGSGPVTLGRPIDWHSDFRNGLSWQPLRARRIDLLDLARPSDVKIPWELSRLHWLIPAGQAYLLDGDDRYGAFVRTIIEEWHDANPPGYGVNWANAMEAGLRAITLIWLFHVFHACPDWRDEGFRAMLVRLIYLHGSFIAGNLERADVNGNHLTADAAGLVTIGLFLQPQGGAGRWAEDGWRLLCTELPRQVHGDGVDFEAASGYHRLALELFLLPACTRIAHGLDVPAAYRARLAAMARFTIACGRGAIGAPLWGDGDDGRVLPFGGQNVNDHRYLPGLVGLAFDIAELSGDGGAAREEALWWFGPTAAARLAAGDFAAASTAYPEGGVYVMRGGGDHVFIDCGPVGLAGRGGHGHNDCLSFEAVLDGAHLVTDCGAFTYSGSVSWRNRLRGTAAHNTPMIDAAEQNRLIRPQYLWALIDDATPACHAWRSANDADLFIGSHAGYLRLDDPVRPVRAIRLDKTAHRLIVCDRFEGAAAHDIRVPYHLTPQTTATLVGRTQWRLECEGRAFILIWQGDAGWRVAVEPGWRSPSYGVKQATNVLVFTREGVPAPLAVALMPAASLPNDADGWLAAAAAAIEAP